MNRKAAAWPGLRPRPACATRRDNVLERTSRAAAWLAELTLQEKAQLCLGSGMWHSAPVPRLGIRAFAMSDGPHGLRKQAPDHAGISGSLPATCFPTASALGSSWDPQLAFRVGQAIGAEAKAQGVTVV